jgi:hypothetical protein
MGEGVARWRAFTVARIHGARIQDETAKARKASIDPLRNLKGGRRTIRLCNE